jgi:hypothetical protein
VEDYILGILGIAISVGLFLIGYRQTVGAKKERVSSANAEVEKILVRRIVLESYTPALIDISRLLEGKARDFRIRVGDLLSESQILNCIFTRIIETDLITQTQREEILSRLLPLLTEAETAPVQEERVVELPSYHRERVIYRITVPLTIALIASFVGGVVTMLPKLGALDTSIVKLLPALTASVALSLGLIAVLYTFYRIRESQQEVSLSSSSSALEQAINFERDVARTVEKAGLKLRPAGPRDRGYDFEVELNGRRVLIEVKAWTRPMPTGLILKIASALNESMKKSGASEALIVTKTPVDTRGLDLSENNVRIVTLRDLGHYLA